MTDDTNAAAPAPAVDARGGWIISDADGARWRTWDNGSPAWTADREQATRYHRREDAEAVHLEDEDAWRVVPFGEADASGSIRHAMERVADLSERWADSLVSQINEIARDALANDKSTTDEDLCQRFRDASRGLGRAGTMEWPGGPYMAMEDAANVYADLMQGGDGRSVDSVAAPAVDAVPAGEVERHLRQALNDSEELGDGSVNITAEHARQLNADVDGWEARALTIEQAWDELVNVDDRTSPEEYPDMCLITREELADFMERAALSHGEGRK